MRRNEEPLAGRRAVFLAVDLEFDVALDDHDELVGVVRVVGPDLAHRIGTTPGAPLTACGAGSRSAFAWRPCSRLRGQPYPCLLR